MDTPLRIRMLLLRRPNVTAGLDPCGLAVTPQVARERECAMAQGLYCHAACLMSRLHASVRLAFANSCTRTHRISRINAAAGVQ